MRKKNVKAQAKKVTLSKELELADLKGKTTFSAVDNITPQASVSNLFNERFLKTLTSIEQTVAQNQHISISIEDTREDPNIVLRPTLNLDPNIHVEPTPIEFKPEIKVPTQRLPDPKEPKVTVNADLSPICWLVAALVFILLFDLALKIWQLPM